MNLLILFGRQFDPYWGLWVFIISAVRYQAGFKQYLSFSSLKLSHYCIHLKYQEQFFSLVQKMNFHSVDSFHFWIQAILLMFLLKLFPSAYLKKASVNKSLMYTSLFWWVFLPCQANSQAHTDVFGWSVVLQQGSQPVLVTVLYILLWFNHWNGLSAFKNIPWFCR